MAAPKGNKYALCHKDWKEKKYKPQQIWEAAIEYLKWCEETPLKSEEVFGTGKRMETSKMRAPTIKGFCLFSQIDRKTLENYEQDKEYLPIITRVRDLIFTAKLEGAAAGLLKENIIAREMGLADASKVEAIIGGLRKTVDDLFPPETEIHG